MSRDLASRRRAVARKKRAMLALHHAPIAQCPASCRPGAGEGCFPPRCGARCCSYWSRKKRSALRAPSNVSLPTWVTNCPSTTELQNGCAALRPQRAANASSSAEPPVILVTLFKNVNIPDLLRFVEYHLLLGVDRAILVDNSCGAHASASKEALAPYVVAGLVEHHTFYVCTELRSMMFMHNFRGGSAMARQLFGMRNIPQGAFIVALDDDEYLTLADARATLQDVRRELVSKRVCAVTLTWRVFGSNGHRCQPHGPLMTHFTRRARTEREVEMHSAQHGVKKKTNEKAAAQHEALTRHLNTPFGGKPVYIYAEPTSPMCGTHWCEECPVGLTNCALPRGAGEACEARHKLTPLRFWINHYAFQSAAHWEIKKARGRTNQLPSRTGGVPPSYDRLLDKSALNLLRARLTHVNEPRLRSCLASLFDVAGTNAAPVAAPRAVAGGPAAAAPQLIEAPMRTPGARTAKDF